MEKFNSIKSLAERIGEILVKGSLYRVFTYEIGDCHTLDGYAATPSSYGLLPRLTKYCDHRDCQQETQWETEYPRVYFQRGVIEERAFACRNCGSLQSHYYFIWHEQPDKKTALFIKVGQYPPLAIEPPPQLAKALGQDDAELYKKALIDANYNHGLGAVAYFRRVLENKVNLILDLIAEALKIEQAESDAVNGLEEIKGSHRVEDKIDFASKILPPHLKPGGHNPLDKLYTAASAGLHGESDDDCLTIFNEARFVFEYLFTNLTVGNEEAREYVKRLSTPIKVQGQRKNRTAVEAEKN